MTDQLPQVEGFGGRLAEALDVVCADGFFTAAGTFNRPTNTTAYAVGQLVANSTTAAAPLEITGVARAIGQSARIERLRLSKSGSSLTNAAFKIHLFRNQPTLNVNDGAAFDAAGVLQVADLQSYIGTFTVAMNYAGTATAQGIAGPDAGSGVTAFPAGPIGHETSLYAIIEANGAYTPVSGESFTVTLEGARS